MKIQESAENYLEAILMLEETKQNVRSIDIVNKMNFSKPSVSVAMKNLREAGYISMDEDGHIKLLEPGREIATKIYERHVLMSKWLVSLGVPQEIAVEDACRIEHVLSQESFDAIKKHVESQRDSK